MRRCDYLAVGHVTADVIEDAPPQPAELEAKRPAERTPERPTEQPGGGAFYSALQAARLGLSALIITKGVPEQIEALLAPYLGEQQGGGRLELKVQPAATTTTLRTWGAGHARRQQVKHWAGPIEPVGNVQCSIAHLAPIAKETPPVVPVGATFVGLTPQGLLRRWTDDGMIASSALDPALLPSRLDAVVFSSAEREHCAALLDRSGPGAGAMIAVTSGAGPVELFSPGGDAFSVEAVEVQDVCDDLGAGDVFAAALFVALEQGASPVEAARYGSAAAAVRIGGRGPDAVGEEGAIRAALSGAGR